jgi:hypothetical protein
MKKLPACLLLLVLLTGCAMVKTPTSAPTVQCSVPTKEIETIPPSQATVETAQPVLYGMWKGDRGDILVISESSVYLVQVDSTGGAETLRESWYEIENIDWVNGVITMNLAWVRVNGKSGGFDMPLHYMKVWIDGSTLMYSLGDEGQGIPESAEIGPFFKK